MAINAKIEAEINKIIEEGRRSGSINMEDVVDRFSKRVDPEEIDEIFNRIQSSGVKMIENVIVQSDDEIEELMNKANIDDPVKMYLKDIGKVDFRRPT